MKDDRLTRLCLETIRRHKMIEAGDTAESNFNTLIFPWNLAGYEELGVAVFDDGASTSSGVGSFGVTVTLNPGDTVWVYALLLLAAYRTWGLLNGPPVPTRWWTGAKRWSFNTLWRQYRFACWGTPPFQALWTRTPGNWLKKEAFVLGLFNAVNASTRI